MLRGEVQGGNVVILRAELLPDASTVIAMQYTELEMQGNDHVLFVFGHLIVLFKDISEILKLGHLIDADLKIMILSILPSNMRILVQLHFYRKVLNYEKKVPLYLG